MTLQKKIKLNSAYGNFIDGKLFSQVKKLKRVEYRTLNTWADIRTISKWIEINIRLHGPLFHLYALEDPENPDGQILVAQFLEDQDE